MNSPRILVTLKGPCVMTVHIASASRRAHGFASARVSKRVWRAIFRALLLASEPVFLLGGARLPDAQNPDLTRRRAFCSIFYG
jgi:hypothetical protein